ncbi:sulfotransferase [Yoonia sp. BS5-3]|uniref:Sulfotransferase n=1 Tax=Yoonia phaeophyticola TaxID=3137369 RepID=A0ABZ2V1L4_9RHOB
MSSTKHPATTQTCYSSEKLVCLAADVPEGIGIFKQHINNDVTDIVAADEVAKILTKCGQYAQAIEYYLYSLEQKPDCSVRLELLAAAHERTGDYIAAVIARQAIIRVNPRCRAAYHNLARLLIRQGRSDDALKVFQELQEVCKDLVGALLGRVVVHRALGQTPTATSLLRDVLSIDPENIDALDALAELSGSPSEKRRLTNKMEELWNDKYTSPDAKIVLGYGLGRIAEEESEHSLAMTYFKKTNLLQIAQCGLDNHSHMDDYVKETIEVFGSKKMAISEIADQGQMTPIFILGMPRSGTTLVEQIFSKHSEVCAGGEQTHMFDLVEQIMRRAKSEETSYPRCLMSYGSDEFSSIGKTFINRAGRTASARAFTDKLPHNFLNIGLIALTLPQARIIHVRRNPLDTCLSIFKNNFSTFHSYARDLRALGKYYRAYQQLMDFWTTRFPARLHLIEYEELVKRPMEVVSNALRFCGLEWEDQCLHYANSPRMARTLSVNQVRQPLNGNSVGIWRNYKQQLVALIDELPDK